MPEHVHMLVQNGTRTLEKVRWVGALPIISERTLSSVRDHPLRYTISDVVQSIKGNFSRRIHAGTIWQRRFNSRIVNTEDRLRNTVYYIKNNPIKAGLSDRYQKSPYQFFNWPAIRQLF
jgi:REP element-mobilizing transposase RayT